MLFRIHDQPAQSKVGSRIADLLSRTAQGQYSQVTLVAAFAKRAGVRRIEPFLRDARDAGATVTSIIGIDHRVTTREGVSDLHAISNELFVVHSTRSDITFHSKAYLFNGASDAVLIVGSSNLTCGGLFTNIETCVEVQFMLPAEADELGASVGWIEQLKDSTKPYIHRVDADNLQQLLDLLPPEIATGPSGAGGAAALVGVPGASQFFGSGDFPAAPQVPVSLPLGAPDAAGNPAVVPAAKGGAPTDGVWKQLSKFDTSPKSAPGSMIIPLALVSAFPAVGARKQMPKGSYQAECEFRIRYIDGPIQKLAKPRFIRYEPAPGHPRPNIEHRLAFHDRSINPNGLAQDDVLLFERLLGDAQGAVFNVYRIRPGQPRFAELTAGGRRFGVVP